MPLQLLGMHIYNWEWISATAPNVFKPWSDIIGSLLVSPAYLLPPLVGLVVLVQHRSNLPSVIEPTLSWRKNALRQNKVDKHLDEERAFRYNLREGHLKRLRCSSPERRTAT